MSTTNKTADSANSQDQAGVLPPTRGTGSQQNASAEVLSDDRIGTLYEEATSYPLADEDYAGVRAFVRAIESELAARFRAAGRNASPESPATSPMSETIDSPELDELLMEFDKDAYNSSIHTALSDNKGALLEHISKLVNSRAASAAPAEGWKLVPVEPTPEILAGAAIAIWPIATPEDIEIARKAAPLVLMNMDLAAGSTVESVAAGIATMAPAYRAMIAAAPSPKEQAQ